MQYVKNQDKLFPQNMFRIKMSMAFLFVFVMANQTLPELQFFKPLRFLAAGILAILSLHIKGDRSLVMASLPFSTWAILVTVMYSDDLTGSLPRSFGMLLMSWCVFNYIWHAHLRDQYNFSKLVIKSIWLILGACFLIYLTPWGNYAFLVGRFRGVFGNPNGLGFFCMLVYPIIDLLVARGFVIDKKQKVLLGILLFACVVLSGSRTALTCILIYEYFKIIQNKPTFFAISLLVFIIFPIIMINIDLETLFEQIGIAQWVRLDSLSDASGRLNVWMIAQDEISKQPWVGRGMLYDIQFINQYRSDHSLLGRHWSGIWNSYYSVLLNFGYIGLVLLMYFFYRLYSASHNKKLSRPYMVMVLFSGITESWFVGAMNSSMPFFLLYFAIQSVPHEKGKVYR